jgi:WD40 repeat protein
MLCRLSVHKDGQLAAVIPQMSNSIHLVDLNAKKTVAVLNGNGEGEAYFLGDVSFSPDGKFLASASFTDQSVIIWDVAERKALHTLRAGESWAPMMVAWSRDSKVLATLDSPRIDLWDARSGDHITRFFAPCSVNVMAFSPKEDLIALGGRDKPFPVLLWRISTKEFTWCWGHTHIIECVAFSPDGKLLVTGSLDGTAKIWEVPSRPLMETEK